MKLSFIIIEYNSINDVLNCLKDIKDLKISVTYEIIVSSNSQYHKNQQQDLVSNFPDIIWSFNSKNSGFAYGMNRGIRLAHGEYIILQNPDTKIIEFDLKNLLSFIKGSNIGLVGPKIINSNNEIQDSCREFLTPIKFIKRLYFRYFCGKSSILDAKFDYEKIQPVDWVIGGFMIIPQSTIEKIGILSEKYFMYVEDMDYCYNIWKHNMKVYYYPKLIVEYEGDRKSARVNPFKLTKFTKIQFLNYLIFLKKYYLNK